MSLSAFSVHLVMFSAGPSSNDGGDGEPGPHRKRRKVSAGSFFAASSDEDEDEDEQEAAAKDELKEYLALPQIKYKSEHDAMTWWLEHQEQFPNLEVMARQYLGCTSAARRPRQRWSASSPRSASPFRPSATRKRSEAATLEDILFAQVDLP